MIALGVVSILVGVIALMNTFAATMATVYVLAAFLLVGGMMNAIDAFTIRRWNLAIIDILAAVLYFVAAVFMFRQPLLAGATVTIVLAALFMVNGAVRFFGALAMQPAHWGWLLLHGAVTFALGLTLFLGLPVTGQTGPGLLIGVDLLFGGISAVAFGITARRAAGGIERGAASGGRLSPLPQ